MVNQFYKPVEIKDGNTVKEVCKKGTEDQCCYLDRLQAEDGRWQCFCHKQTPTGLSIGDTVILKDNKVEPRVTDGNCEGILSLVK
jgi:hypothetical protein